MTFKTLDIPVVIMRVSAVASIMAGIFMAAAFILHPVGEDATFGTDPFWVPAHTLAWIAFTLALLGWVGLYLIQASRVGKLGVVGFSASILGTSLATWIFSSDITFVPVIAAKQPALFQDIFNNFHIIIGVGSVLAWVLGNILFGLSIIRAGIFSKWTGVMLAIGSLIFPIAYLSHLPMKVIAVGAILVGASQTRLGYELLGILKKSPPSKQ